MFPTGMLTVDLKAIKANWQKLNQEVGSGVVCAAVVKANAYGLGVGPVAESLYEAGCRAFFVATLVEAKALRQQLSEDSRIFVLGGLCHEGSSGGISNDWKDYQLSPVLIDKEHVVRWAGYCIENEPMPCIVKVDTGMHRLGISPDELENLLVSGHLQESNLEYVMSHFACADVQEHPLNQQQLTLFRQCIAKISESLPDIKASMANSCGIFLGNSAYFHMVRPGAALYGVNPVEGNANPMLPVAYLSLPVMQIKSIARGESVGYGAEFVAQEETRIAIIFGGYADGLFRTLGQSGNVFFEDVACPMIGRVSMDSFAVDVSQLDVAALDRLQAVDLLNEKQTVDCLAKQAGTIGYEILTSLGERYQRRYLK